MLSGFPVFVVLKKCASHGHFILYTSTSNQIIFIGLRSSKDYYTRPGGGVGIWEGSLGCEFLRGSMCAEGMGCGRRWVKWVLRGTGTASGHPGVP